MKEIKLKKLSSTYQVKGFVRNLPNGVFIQNCRNLYISAFEMIEKTKTRREFTSEFVKKLLKVNRNSDQLAEIISHHRSRYPNPSKVDEFLYRPVENIRLIRFSTSGYSFKRIIDSVGTIGSNSSGLTSVLHKSTEKLKMKPIYNTPRS